MPRLENSKRRFCGCCTCLTFLQGSSNFKYGLIVPIFGPIIGGIVAVLLYNVIPW